MAGLAEWIRLNWSVLAFIAIVAVAFMVLRNRPTPGITSITDLDQALHNGQPVVLDFYSNL